MRRRQFLPYTRLGDIELGRREGTEEGVGGGGGVCVGGWLVGDEREEVKVCVCKKR